MIVDDGIGEGMRCVPLLHAVMSAAGWYTPLFDECAWCFGVCPDCALQGTTFTEDANFQVNYHMIYRRWSAQSRARAHRAISWLRDV